MKSNPLLETLHRYLVRLADLSPDGVQLQNGIGFSGATLAPGLRLVRSFPYWQIFDAEKAFEIARLHSRQLGIDSVDLAAQWEVLKPDLDSACVAIADQAREIAAAQVAEQKTSDSPFGINFSAWKSVNTRVGPRRVRSGEPTPDFWAAWKGDKEGIKAAGFSLGKGYQSGQWEVAQWEKSTASAPEAAKPLIAPAPLARPEGLLAYQVAPVSLHIAAIKNFGASIDASDTGTGKTYSALAACRELGFSPLVIAPKSVLSSWQRAATHLGVTLSGVINYEKIKTGNTVYGKWEGKGKDEKFVFASTVKALIFDEVHRAKGVDTANAFLVRAAKEQGIPTFALSATLAHNPMEMRAIGNLIGLCSWSGFWRWASAHGCNKNPWGGMDFNGSRLVLEKLHREIFPAKGARVRIADLGDAFPETQIAAEAYNLNGAASEIDRIDAEMHAEIEALFARACEDKASARAAALVAMLRARQRAELVKVPLFVELAQDAIESGQSVAVFVCFAETLDAIAARLSAANIPCAQIRGGQSADERETGIAAFQADQIHCILAMIQAGGVGVSLHDLHGNRARASFISPTWSAVELRQTLGRVHRAGGKTKSTQRIVFVADSVEENVRRTVESKLTRLDTLNDGDLGKPEHAASVEETEADREEHIETEEAIRNER